MRIFKKVEFKLFITFFLISSFFAYWTSWNEETNFVLIKAIIDDKSFYLDKYQNKTGDVIPVRGHLFAQFQRWGFSILTAHIYFFSHFFTQNEFVLKFLFTALVSSLFFSLSILLIYKLSKKFFKRERDNLLASFSYGVSTLAFQQARLFTIHSLETFLATQTLYLLLFISKNERFKSIILLGAFTGLGLLLTPLFRILFLLLLLGLIWKGGKSRAVIFLITSILIYLPTFITYLRIVKPFLAFFSPTTYDNLPFIPKDFKGITFPPSAFFQLTLFPSKGLLFFYPILIFSFLGTFLIKKYKIESLSCQLFIIFTLLAISFLVPMWWLGWVSYGPSRVLTILMPFFFLGLIGFVKKFGWKLLLPFFFISMFNNVLLLQYGEDKISSLSWEEYKYKMENFQILSNPLFEHYLPLTLINGPRSVLLENLIVGKKIVIDLKHSYNLKTPEFIPSGSPIIKKFEVYLFYLPKVGMVVLKLPWLSLFIVAFLFVVIWQDEILNKLKIKGWALFLTLILIFLILFIRIRDFVYGDNWCPPQWHENEKKLDEGRWIGQNATLFLFSKKESNKTLRFIAESFKGNQTLEVYLNEKFLNNYTLERRKEIFQPIQLKEGINVILLRSREFINPWSIYVGCDINWISFKISKISII